MLNDRVGRNEDSITAAAIEWKKMAEKIDALESYTRRNNIKIVGLPEGVEGEDPIIFFQDWIKNCLGVQRPGGIEIERAHRALRPKPSANEKPRSVLIKFLRFQDREMVLKSVGRNIREGKPIKYKGNKLLFYPDISNALLKRKKEFNKAKNILWKKGYKFTLLHPATLKIMIKPGENKFFKDFVQAQDFAEVLPRREDQEGPGE